MYAEKRCNIKVFRQQNNQGTTKFIITITQGIHKQYARGYVCIPISIRDMVTIAKINIVILQGARNIRANGTTSIRVLIRKKLTDIRFDSFESGIGETGLCDLYKF
ncbi:hypothetical protein CQZ99_24810 [Pseudomonas poae]|uniref:Uncharacterized protein n=1 Tax=Pseudomonas poae TaxID=200451 RepID=A0A2S9E9P5_9PSED|nr:hypothetical protein CQZ97_18360 [Pseudomonas poae]PRC11604.1 hypothetical protein CQZ99_24810 [Pseudomonas poae]